MGLDFVAGGGNGNGIINDIAVRDYLNPTAIEAITPISRATVAILEEGEQLPVGGQFLLYQSDASSATSSISPIAKLQLREFAGANVNNLVTDTQGFVVEGQAALTAAQQAFVVDIEAEYGTVAALKAELDDIRLRLTNGGL
jgi:hypothetical protein